MSDLLIFVAGFLTCFFLIVFVAWFIIRAAAPPSKQTDDAVVGNHDPWRAK
jgi:hypothetical protein